MLIDAWVPCSPSTAIWARRVETASCNVSLIHHLPKIDASKGYGHPWLYEDRTDRYWRALSYLALDHLSKFWRGQSFSLRRECKSGNENVTGNFISDIQFEREIARILPFRHLQYPNPPIGTVLLFSPTRLILQRWVSRNGWLKPDLHIPLTRLSHLLAYQ